MISLNKPILVVLILIASQLGCGYRFSGGGTLPGGIQSVFITTFQNHSSTPGIENIFTNDLIYEFTRNDLMVLKSQKEAEAVLSGVIRAVSDETVSRLSTLKTVERRVLAMVDLKLTKTDGNVIWSVKGIRSDENYRVISGNKSLTDASRREALSQLSKRIAESVYSRMTDKF
jgi:hypothetical protein